MVICLEQSADCLIDCPADATASQTLTSLASFKCRLLIPTWYWLTQVILEKRPLNGCSSGNYSLCPGLPRWAGTRKVKPTWFYWSKRQWVAVASAGPYASLHLDPDRYPIIPIFDLKDHSLILHIFIIWFEKDLNHGCQLLTNQCKKADLTWLYLSVYTRCIYCQNYTVQTLLCTVYLLWVIMPRI